ncbi:MAG: TolC family protein [Planctomycetes bacterium]|nr:TolC family protein [Planctomycetota bacterium]
MNARRTLALLPVVLAAATCASPSHIPPAETQYAAEKLAAAAAAPSLDTRAATISAPAGVAPVARVSLAPTAGIIDLDAAPVAAFVAKLGEPGSTEAALATTPFDEDIVLASVWTRNPAVAAARADVESARRVYEQASWLDDIETGMRSPSLPMVGAGAGMPTAPLPYPGLAALRGEMLDREVDMAVARLRMRFLESGADAVDAYHIAAHHVEEAVIRHEQVRVLERLVEAARTRVESGRAPQAEMLEAQSELAMAKSDVEHAETSEGAARRRLNSLIDRDPDAPLVLATHGDPADTTPDAAALVALARRAAPEIAMARAEALRLGAAERMSRRMTNPGTQPGAAAMAGGDVMAPEVGDAPPAWAAEIASRRASAELAVVEAERSVERMVAAAVFDVSAMARMFGVAAKSTEPATRQAMDERLRLYEGGRGEFGDVLGAVRRHLNATHDVAQARHEYRSAEAMLWKAVGARPELSGGVR